MAISPPSYHSRSSSITSQLDHLVEQHALPRGIHPADVTTRLRGIRSRGSPNLFDDVPSIPPPLYDSWSTAPFPQSHEDTYLQKSDAADVKFKSTKTASYIGDSDTHRCQPQGSPVGYHNWRSAALDGLGMRGYGTEMENAGLRNRIPDEMKRYKTDMLRASAISPEVHILALHTPWSGSVRHGYIGIQGGGPLIGEGSKSAGPPGSGLWGNGTSKLNYGRARRNDTAVDPELLDDVPAWLRTLRLHKYVPMFEGMTWREIVVLDEPALEAKGITTLGARGRMLRAFESVRMQMGIEGPASAPVIMST